MYLCKRKKDIPAILILATKVKKLKNGEGEKRSGLWTKN